MAADIRVIHVRDFLVAKQALHQIADALPASEAGIMVDVREAPAHLTAAQLSQLATEFSRLRIGAGRKTAVLTASDRFDDAHLFAVSARGMGRDVQAFTSFEDAFDWLVL